MPVTKNFEKMTFEDFYNSYTVGLIASENTRTYGTCFIGSLRDDTYLITDCHVLFCKYANNLYDKRFSVRLTNQDSGPDDGVIFSLNIQLDDVLMDTRLDIALIKLNGLNENKCEFYNESINAISPLSISVFDISRIWGKDVYIAGFPHSVTLDKPFDSKPILSRGILSAIDSVKGYIVLDIPSIYGLSGSPVLYVENDDILLMGIVQKLFPFNAEWFSKNEPGISRSDWHNSGYTKCLSSVKIKEFIENHEGAN